MVPRFLFRVPGSVLWATIPLLALGCARRTADDDRQPSESSALSTGPRADRGVGARVARPAAAEAPEGERPTESGHVRADGQLGPGRGTLVIDLEAKPGFKLTEGAPLRVRASGAHLHFPDPIRTQASKDRLPLRLPIIVDDGALGPADVTINYYACSLAQAAVCRPERADLKVDLDLSGSSEGGEAHFTHRVGS